MHEMPDLFKIGEWWYLITTEYSHASKQVYRMAKSLKGPWIAPEDDGFDGRAYYAGRTFELNGQRIIFGWVPSRANETDSAHLTYDEIPTMSSLSGQVLLWHMRFTKGKMEHLVVECLRLYGMHLKRKQCLLTKH